MAQKCQTSRRKKPMRSLFGSKKSSKSQDRGSKKLEKQPQSWWIRFLKEWGPIVVIGGGLYATGLHTEVIGRLQQLMLYTGIMNPKPELPSKENRQPVPMVESVTSSRLIVEGLDGGITHLNSFIGENVVFINFWATWCPPCIAEMPSIQNLADSLPEDADVEFMMISMDEERGVIHEFIEKRGFTFPIYVPRMVDQKVYPINAIPTTYVIDKQGQIAYQKSSLAKYDTREFREFILTLASE